MKHFLNKPKKPVHDPDAFGASRLPFLDVFFARAKAHPSRTFLRQPDSGKIREISYGEAAHAIKRMAAALGALGHRPGDRVGIYSKNCAHWILADLAILAAGCVSVPYYPTVNAEALRELVALSHLKSLFVGKVEHWDAHADAVPSHVTCIAFPHYAGNAKVNGMLDWDELIAAYSPRETPHHPQLDEAFTVIFTSGTTGTPKGVVLNYEAPRQLAVHERADPVYEIFDGSAERLFSYLPLNHVAERFATEIAGIFAGSTISFAESIDTFAKDLRAVQPSLFFSVPRIWIKMHESVVAKVGEVRLQKLLATPLVGTALTALLRYQLGLLRARVVISGAAPLPRGTIDFFARLGVHIQEVYGMSEAGGAVSFNPRGRVRAGSVGLPIRGTTLRIDPDTSEIFIRTPWMMTGYFRDPERTAAIMADGFIRSGDRGVIDNAGYLTITGRVSETFKTSKGKFVVPSALEARFFTDTLVEHALVTGLGLAQPIALVCLTERARSLGRVELARQLEQKRHAVNESAEKHEKIACLVVLDRCFSVADGSLTPTLKMRRHVIDTRYGADYARWSEGKLTVVFEADETRLRG